LLPPLCSHFQWLSLCVSSLRILTRNSRTKYLVFCHTSNTFLTAVFQNLPAPTASMSLSGSSSSTISPTDPGSVRTFVPY
jgi:hypothetical protein